MNKIIKYISAAIIIFIFVFLSIIVWKVIDNIRQEVCQDLQKSFKESLSEYGKR